MKDPRNKNESLSETTKTYCQTWLKEKLYNREKEFSNKYIQKGLIVEDNSIDLIAEQLGYGMLFKNEESFENDFMTGTPDILIRQEKTVIDAKSSWDVFTFPRFETEIPNKDYFYQGHGYLNLTGSEHFKLCYVLVDTPEHLIESEMRRYAYQNGYEFDDMNYGAWYNRFTYRDIAESERIKTFSFDKDESVIERVNNRVLECREYINYLIKNI